MLGQTASVAYGRALCVICPRYLDSFAVSILVNFACLLAIAQAHIGKRQGWTIAWGFRLDNRCSLFSGPLRRQTPARRTVRQARFRPAQEINTREYLATGNFQHLQDKPLMHVPYPDPEHLAIILESPEIRSILPANIHVPLEPEAAASRPADALGPKTAAAWLGVGAPSAVGRGRLDPLVSRLLAHYYLFIAMGFAAAIVLVVRNGLTRIQSQRPAVELSTVRLDGFGLRC